MKPQAATMGRHVQRWLLVTPFVAAVACGGPQALGGAGENCFRDDECQAGLICVAPVDDELNRVCSNDPTPLISNVEGPPIMEMMAGTAGAGGMAGAMPLAGGGMGAMAGGGMAGSGGNAGSAGSDTAGTAGSGGTDAGGSGGSAGAAGTAGSGGTEPEGGAAN